MACVPKKSNTCLILVFFLRQPKDTYLGTFPYMYVYTKSSLLEQTTPVGLKVSDTAPEITNIQFSDQELLLSQILWGNKGSQQVLSWPKSWELRNFWSLKAIDWKGQICERWRGCSALGNLGDPIFLRISGIQDLDEREIGGNLTWTEFETWGGYRPGKATAKLSANDRPGPRPANWTLLTYYYIYFGAQAEEKWRVNWLQWELATFTNFDMNFVTGCLDSIAISKAFADSLPDLNYCKVFLARAPLVDFLRPGNQMSWKTDHKRGYSITHKSQIGQNNTKYYIIDDIRDFG